MTRYATQAPLDTRDTAKLLIQKGYHVVPVIWGQKAAAVTDWQHLRLGPSDLDSYFPPGKQVSLGLIMGTQVAPEVHLAGVDVDIDDDLLISRIQLALPSLGPQKKGKKGLTFIGRTLKPMKSRKISRKDPVSKATYNAVDFLGERYQTVLPPSPHPSGDGYVWLGRPLQDFDPGELPLIDASVLDEIELAIKDPDSKIFAINTMNWLGEGKGGNVHDSCLISTGVMVSRNWTEDQTKSRCRRAATRAVEEGGDNGWSWAAFDADLNRMVEGAMAKGFMAPDGEKLPKARRMAEWMISELGGRQALWLVGGSSIRNYRHGHWPEIRSHHLEHRFYVGVATADAPDIKKAAQLVGMAAPDRGSPSTHRICLLNGTLDMDTGQLLPWDPEDRILHQLDFNFDPDAQCPRWEEFLAETFTQVRGEQDRRTDAQMDDDAVLAANTFEEFFALTLFEELKYHKMLVLKGPPGTGKSTLLHVLRAMHGTDSVSATPIIDLGDERWRTSLVGKLVNICGEVPVMGHVADEALKAIVSGDPISVRRLYREGDMAQISARIIVAGNEMFRTRDTSGAVERRMIVLGCDNQIPERKRDNRLPDKLIGERTGILNRLVVAWARLRARGYFEPPGSSALAISKFTEENDPVRTWLMERTRQGEMNFDVSKLTAAEKSHLRPTSSQDLYSDYAEWSRNNGFKQISVITWGTRLTQAGFPAKPVRLGNKVHRARMLTLHRMNEY